MQHETVLEKLKYSRKGQGGVEARTCMYVVRTRHDLYLAHKAQTYTLYTLYILRILPSWGFRLLPDGDGCFKQLVIHEDTHGKLYYAVCIGSTAVSQIAASPFA